MRPIPSLWSSRFALVLPIAAACGGAVVGVGPGGGSHEDAGVDAGNCGLGEGPEPVCCVVNPNGCGEFAESPTCGPSGWTCAAGATLGPGTCGPPCENLDGGGPGDASFTDGGSGGDGFSGDGSFGDSGFGDGSTGDSSTGDAGVFSCGPQGLLCDGTAQYCNIVEGGVVLPDAGSNVHPSCVSIPAACEGAPGSLCDCIEQQTHMGGTFCQENGGDVTVTLALP